MIYLVHGDDLSKSRALITNQQKKLNIEKRTDIDLSEKSFQFILEAAQATDLFGNLPFIVVEATGSAKNTLEDLADNISKIPLTATVILLFDKELTKTNPLIKKVNEGKIKELISNKAIESNVFKFVDAIFNKNRISTYKELEKLFKENSDPFYLFSMILYGLRNIALVVLKSPSMEKMSPFIKSKVMSQAKAYTEEDIKSIFSYYYDLDKKAKTGGVEPDVMLTLAIEKVLNS